MRLTIRRSVQLFALVLPALLALPILYGSSHTTAARGQDAGQSDVKQRPKQRLLPMPSIVDVAAPANDNCTNAISIASCPFTDTNDTTGATDEAGEPQSTCTVQGKSVWYSLPASVNRRTVTVNTCGSNFDTAIMVWQVTGGACAFAGFVPVACNDDSSACGSGFQSSVGFTAQAGQTYKLQIGGFGAATGSLVVNVACQDLICDDIVVNGQLGLGSPNYPSFSGQQTPARLFRDGSPSTCNTPKICPGPFNSGSFTFDAYTFTNESNATQCVTVEYRPNIGCNVNAHAIAYLGSYSPTNLCLNYLADVGSSDDLDYSFEVPAGANFVVVIAANNPGGTGNGCAYQFTVVGNICFPFDVCLQDDSNPSIVFLGNSQTGAYRFCCGGTTFTGSALVTRRGNIVTFQHYASDRRVLATYDGGVFKGTASLQKPPGTTRCTIGDRNTTNNTCVCQ